MLFSHDWIGPMGKITSTLYGLIQFYHNGIIQRFHSSKYDDMIIPPSSFNTMIPQINIQTSNSTSSILDDIILVVIDTFNIVLGHTKLSPSLDFMVGYFFGNPLVEDPNDSIVLFIDIDKGPILNVLQNNDAILEFPLSIRIYVDFCDLNKAYPKDNHPTPYIDDIIYSMVRHELLSLMDKFFRYNRILIVKSDHMKITFVTLWGTFAYHIMPFSLLNTGTNQKAITRAFHDIFNIYVDDYLDDLSVKSCKHCDHFEILCLVFNRCRRYHIYLNLHKCILGVCLGCILGYIIFYKGIHIDPSKVAPIMDLPPLINLTQLKSFLGEVRYMRIFIKDNAKIVIP